MATKSKKQRKRRTSGDLFQQVHRNFEKGKYKQALKDAKVCFRQAPTEEHRRFLECAHMGRAQQLSEQGLYDQCRNVLESLLDLGVTEPAVQSALPNLLLSVGMLDRLPPGCERPSAEAEAQSKLKAADVGVLRPQAVPASMSKLRPGAKAIRDALDALERGDENAALAQLKGIPRESAFADWKLFDR